MNHLEIREAFPAIVVDNEDEEKRGRLKVACAHLMGVDAETGEAKEYPFWVEPAGWMLSGDGSKTTAGCIDIPTPGTVVTLEVTTGNTRDRVPGESFVANPSPVWFAPRLIGRDEFPGTLATNYPNRRGWTTPSGHELVFDDSDGDKGQVWVKHRSGAIVQIDNDGKITLKTDGDVAVECKEAVVTAQSKAKVDAALVELGQGSLDSLIKSTQFKTLFATHTHSAGAFGGPTGPPTPPVVWTPAETTSVKAG